MQMIATVIQTAQISEIDTNIQQLRISEVNYVQELYKEALSDTLTNNTIDGIVRSTIYLYNKSRNDDTYSNWTALFFGTLVACAIKQYSANPDIIRQADIVLQKTDNIIRSGNGNINDELIALFEKFNQSHE